MNEEAEVVDREPVEAPQGGPTAARSAAGWKELAGALLGLVAAAALVPAGLRVALDQAGSTYASVAVAFLLIGCAAGAAARPRAAGPVLLRLLVALVAAPVLLLVLAPLAHLLWPLLGGTVVGAFLLRSLILAALLPAAVAAGTALRYSASSGGGEAGELPTGFRPGVAAAAVSLGLAFGGAVLLPMLGLKAAAGAGLLLCALGTALAWSGRPEGEPAFARPPEALSTALVAGLSLGAAVVCWERTIALLAGPTELNAFVVATTALLGLAAGVILIPLAARPGRLLMTVALLAAAALLIDASAFLVPGLSTWCAGLVAAGGSAARMLGVAAALALILPAAIAFGGAIACLASSGRERADGLRREGGVDAGGILSPLAAGAALGVLLGAELLVPSMGLRRGLALASALGLFALLPLLARVPFAKPATKGSVSLGILVAMVLVGGFPASWDPRVTAGGVYRYGVGAAARFDDPDGWLASRLRGAPPEFYREGRHATVTVEHTVQRVMAPAIEAETLVIDGRAVGNTGIDARSQILAGEIPMLLHGPADRALVIDFSLGLTAGSVLRHPVRAVSVIEREPAVIEAAPIFAALANNPGGDPRLRIVHDDPVARLRSEKTTYDVIVLTGTDPWLPHLAGLITDEGYALLRSRIPEKGIVAQRFSLGAVPDPLLTAWMRAFLKAFPSVLVFQTSPDDLLLVGSPSTVRIDPEAIRKTVAGNAAIADDLSRATVIGPDEIVLTARLDAEGLRKVLGDGPSNPDDLRAVTVAAARDLQVQRGSRLPERVDGAWAGLEGMLAPVQDPAVRETRAALLYRVAKSYLGLAGDPTRALSVAKDLQGLGEMARARWVTGEAYLQQRDVDGALKEWEAVLALEPDNLDALFSLGMFHFDARDYFDAERYLGRAAKAHGDTAVVLYNHGRALYQVGRYEPAITELQQARSISVGRESYPLVDYFVGLSAARLKRDSEAEKSLKDYLKWAYTQDTLTRVEVDAHLKLAEVLERRGSRLEGFQERQKATRLSERIQAYASAHSSPAAGGREDVPDSTGSGAGSPAPGPASDTIVPPPGSAAPAPGAAAPGSIPPPSNGG
ncbi:MAG TPA: tetratricopeptide repeat protein [Verrucomicrobiae bacterium]|nr:tetratricopeptide repeat protein [Verrucomicrobiae bacterium]